MPRLRKREEINYDFDQGFHDEQDDDDYGAPKKKKQKVAKKPSKKELAKKLKSEQDALLNQNIARISKLGTVPTDTLGYMFSFIPAFPFLLSYRRVNKLFKAVIDTIVLANLETLDLLPHPYYEYYMDQEQFIREAHDKNKLEGKKKNEEEEIDVNKEMTVWKQFCDASFISKQSDRYIKPTLTMLAQTFPRVKTVLYQVPDCCEVNKIPVENYLELLRYFPNLETLHLFYYLNLVPQSSVKLPSNLKRVVVYNWKNTTFSMPVETIYCEKIGSPHKVLIELPELNEPEFLQYLQYYKSL